MKKFLVLFLIFTAAAGIFAPRLFAQFSWNLASDFNSGLLSWNLPTGEKAEKVITVNNSIVPNTSLGANNPVNERGDYTYNSGGLDVFTYGRGTWLRSNELRLTIDFMGEAVDFHTRTLLDPLVANVTTTPGGANNTTGNHSLVMGDGRTPNWNDLLRYSFDEWYIRGYAWFLTAAAGNTPDRGKVEDFSALFTDDVLRTVVVENYGVNTPTADADFDLNGRDANNFRTRPGTELGKTDPYEWVMPYLMLGARFSANAGKLKFPLTFQLATDPGQNSGINGVNNYKRYNGSVRVSAEQIANTVTFDVIYRFRGGDPSTLNNYDENYNTAGTLQPDGTGSTSHTFGLYANILNVPDLGIGLGYSGYAVTYEDDANTYKETTKKTITTTGPLYSGIDLRLQYTGLKNMVITSHNNVSFAVADHSTENAKSLGVLGSELDGYSSQGWFSLYNAIGLDIGLGARLAASFQIANRYGAISTYESLISGGISKTKRSRNQLGGGGFVAFQFNQFILVQGGLAFRYLNDAYNNDAPGAQIAAATRNASGGSFDIAIPIRVNVVFQSR